MVEGHGGICRRIKLGPYFSHCTKSTVNVSKDNGELSRRRCSCSSSLGHRENRGRAGLGHKQGGTAALARGHCHCLCTGPTPPCQSERSLGGFAQEPPLARARHVLLLKEQAGGGGRRSEVPVWGLRSAQGASWGAAGPRQPLSCGDQASRH